jgi:hypothetical protein
MDGQCTTYFRFLKVRPRLDPRKIMHKTATVTTSSFSATFRSAATLPFTALFCKLADHF